MNQPFFIPKIQWSTLLLSYQLYYPLLLMLSVPVLQSDMWWKLSELSPFGPVIGHCTFYWSLIGREEQLTHCWCWHSQSDLNTFPPLCSYNYKQKLPNCQQSSKIFLHLVTSGWLLNVSCIPAIAYLPRNKISAKSFNWRLIVCFNLYNG